MNREALRLAVDPFCDERTLERSSCISSFCVCLNDVGLLSCPLVTNQLLVWWTFSLLCYRNKFKMWKKLDQNAVKKTRKRKVVVTVFFIVYCLSVSPDLFKEITLDSSWFGATGKIFVTPSADGSTGLVTGLGFNESTRGADSCGTNIQLISRAFRDLRTYVFNISGNDSVLMESFGQERVDVRQRFIASSNENLHISCSRLQHLICWFGLCERKKRRISRIMPKTMSARGQAENPKKRYEQIAANFKREVDCSAVYYNIEFH